MPAELDEKVESSAKDFGRLLLLVRSRSQGRRVVDDPAGEDYLVEDKGIDSVGC